MAHGCAAAIDAAAMLLCHSQFDPLALKQALVEDFSCALKKKMLLQVRAIGFPLYLPAHATQLPQHTTPLLLAMLRSLCHLPLRHWPPGCGPTPAQPLFAPCSNRARGLPSPSIASM